MGQLGDLLRESRKAKGLSLDQVEAQLKIRRRLLQALEEEQFDALPAPVFAKGFLKNYARLLDLDLDHVLELYREIVGETSQPYDLQVLSEPLEQGPGAWPLLLAIVLLVTLMAVAAWIANQQGLIRLPHWLVGQAPLATVASTATTRPTNTVTPPTHTIEPTRTATARPTGTATETHALPTETMVSATATSAAATASPSWTRQPSSTPTVQPTGTATARSTRTATTRPTLTATARPATATPSIVAAAPTTLATATAEPSATPNLVSAATTPPPDGTVSVELEYQAEAWMRIYVDGLKVYEGLVPAGTTQSWRATQHVYVHCGYGSGVLATVNGQLYGALGPEPDTVRVEWSIAAGTPSVESVSLPTQVILATIMP